MEPIVKDSYKVKGAEVLFFEDAEVTKMKANSRSFASVGHLSVLYFSDYHRYVLQINDWRFPLLRRLPVIASDKNDLTSRTYTLPALNGFTYVLTIKFPNVQLLSNFETILADNSNFSFKGEETPFKKIEASPDDKLTRTKSKETVGIFSKISETMKTGIEKVKVATETFKTGTKNINSRKKMVDLKTIKNKDFKKRAHSSFKKDFFESSEKLSKEFLRMRRENPNLTQSRNISELAKSVSAPSFYIFKEDIEEAILNNKDLACSGQCNFIMGAFEEKKAMPVNESFKESITPSKESLSGRAPTLSDAPGHLVTMMMDTKNQANAHYDA